MFHRDVSKGNLMMTERRGDDEGPWGVLNDWDRATSTRADLEFPCRTVRIFCPIRYWITNNKYT